MIVQISGTFGSRQEEAQRLGRVLRPKADGGSACFYTLVSNETNWSRSSAQHRQLFLTEQGYAYEILDAAASIQACLERAACAAERRPDCMARTGGSGSAATGRQEEDARRRPSRSTSRSPACEADLREVATFWAGVEQVASRAPRASW